MFGSDLNTPMGDIYYFFIEINVDTTDDLLASLEKYIHKKRGILIQGLKNISTNWEGIMCKTFWKNILPYEHM